MKMSTWLHVVAFALTVVGALNWGLVGLFGFNLVSSLLPSFEQVVYILVGVSAVYVVLAHPTDCKTCSTMMKGKK